MSNVPKDQSVYRFIELVRDITTRTTSQKLLLYALVNRANHKTGLCRPSYLRLMRDTGLSRGTVYSALVYLRDTLKILTWEKGHSNQYAKAIANEYKFDYSAMTTLAAKCVAEFTNCTQQESAEFTPCTQHALLSTNEQFAEFKSESAEFKSEECRVQPVNPKEKAIQGDIYPRSHKELQGGNPPACSAVQRETDSPASLSARQDMDGLLEKFGHTPPPPAEPAESNNASPSVPQKRKMTIAQISVLIGDRDEYPNELAYVMAHPDIEMVR